MLPRRSTLKHPSGLTRDLPCLIPSFSSKGFPFFRKKQEDKMPEYSETTLSLELLGPFIKDFILVSAYDLHWKWFREPEKYFDNKALIFIDSGGYELTSDWDGTEPVQYQYKSLDFSEDDYIKVLEKLPSKANYVIANHDWTTRKKSFEDQIKAAQKLFNRFPQHGKSFVGKPGEKERHGYLNIEEVKSCLGLCKNFDIIGFTEKELGEDILERMENIAKIRVAMDQEGMKIPIHIWGGLDPVVTPLYFFAGAEIFDGVSWLRYAYYNGVAIYRDAFGILNTELGLTRPTDHIRAISLNHNIAFLQNLTTLLQRFVDKKGKDFSMFDGQREVFEKAYQTFITKTRALQGGNNG